MGLRDRFQDRFTQRWTDRIEQIASEELERGATPENIRQRMMERLRAEAPSRPFFDFLMKLFEQFLPLLLELLGRGVTGGFGPEVSSFPGEFIDKGEADKDSPMQLVDPAEDTIPVEGHRFAQMMSPKASQDLQVLAGFFNVDRWKLITCIAAQVGWVKMIECLRTSSENWLSCVMQNVDFQGLIACLTGAVVSNGSGATGSTGPTTGFES